MKCCFCDDANLTPTEVTIPSPHQDFKTPGYECPECKITFATHDQMNDALRKYKELNGGL